MCLGNEGFIIVGVEEETKRQSKTVHFLQILSSNIHGNPLARIDLSLTSK